MITNYHDITRKRSEYWNRRGCICWQKVKYLSPKVENKLSVFASESTCPGCYHPSPSTHSIDRMSKHARVIGLSSTNVWPEESDGFILQNTFLALILAKRSINSEVSGEQNDILNCIKCSLGGLGKSGTNVINMWDFYTRIKLVLYTLAKILFLNFLTNLFPCLF